MSKFIDLVETFSFSTMFDEGYAKKIKGLLNRFPKYEKDEIFRTVLPTKYPKTTDDYISMKFCVRGRFPVFGIYSRRDLNLVAICVEGNMFAFDSFDLHSSYVPDLNVRKLVLDIQYTPLATHETPNFTRQNICSAISTLSLGYTPEKKNEWCDAVVLLAGITSHAVRFHGVSHGIQMGFLFGSTEFDIYGVLVDNRYLAMQNRWNKISKAIRRGDYPFVFGYYSNIGMYVSGFMHEYEARGGVLLINDKEKKKRVKIKRRLNKWNGPLKKSKRTRLEERARITDMEQTKRIEAAKTSQMKMNNNFSMHGFWYGSVGTFKYEIACAKCLPKPTQMVRADSFFKSATSHLDRLKDVFAAASFFLCTIRHEVSTSMKNFCFDHLGVSKEVIDLKKVKWNREPRPFVQLGWGRFSRAFGETCCVYPLQVITTRMQAQHFIADNGWGRFLRAFGETCCVYPLQVITTRMQAQHFIANNGYSGMSDVFRTLQHKGLRGFYKGLVPNLLNLVPSARASTKRNAAILVVDMKAKGLLLKK